MALSFNMSPEICTSGFFNTILRRPKYFNLDERKAKNDAARNKYPFPVFRPGGQKSEWMVDAADFAKYLDEVKEKAAREHAATH